jgi:hypothetical protein
MPDGQHTENLAWIREQIGEHLPDAPGLASLMQRALAGEGDILRVSPQRTVLRLDATDSFAAPYGWLLKIFHPRRRTESLRRLVSVAPAQREYEAWQRLAARLAVPLRADSEQLESGVGLFARAFWQGHAAQADEATAHSLAALHKARWIDRDLALPDLLWWTDAEGERQLLPLDLGHAQVTAVPLPPEQIYRSLARLLSGLDPELARNWAPELLDAHAQVLPGWQVKRLLNRSTKLRSRRAWRRSARALRDCSDFKADESGAHRRGFTDEAPAWPLALHDGIEILSQGPRSSTLRAGDVVWKFYPRPGASQAVRRVLGGGPGRLAYRNFAALEILGIASAQARAWLKHPQGEWIATRFVAGPQAELGATDELADWLAALHENGFGMRDMKCSNFCLQEPLSADGTPAWVLVDADGITPRVEDAARDLARLLAEHPRDGEATAKIQSRYFAVRGAADASFLRQLDEKTSQFRAKLAAAQDPSSG